MMVLQHESSQAPAPAGDCSLRPVLVDFIEVHEDSRTIEGRLDYESRL
jgi:hypothetical protein